MPRWGRSMARSMPPRGAAGAAGPGHGASSAGSIHRLRITHQPEPLADYLLLVAGTVGLVRLALRLGRAALRRVFLGVAGLGELAVEFGLGRRDQLVHRGDRALR